MRKRTIGWIAKTAAAVLTASLALSACGSADSGNGRGSAGTAETQVSGNRESASRTAAQESAGQTAGGQETDAQEPSQAESAQEPSQSESAQPSESEANGETETGDPASETTAAEEFVTTVYGELSSIGIRAEAESYSDRALTAVQAAEGVFVSWRCYEEDSADISFTLMRNGETVYTGNRTCFMDASGKAGDVYKLTASEGLSAEGEETKAWGNVYQELTLQVPPDQNMPDPGAATFAANDMSVGDLDGDGELELIVKWYPSNAQDNSKDGYTGTTILDAYDIDLAEGTAKLMWRIDLGINIRSGAHYTQFQVWDYDGDGKAELICKTADGSTTYDANLQETGHVGAVSMAQLRTDLKGKPADYDFRQHMGRKGRIVLGQEYLTAFDGETGEIIDTVEYVPERGPYDEATGTYDTRYWGLKNGSPAEKNDGYANRADRFLAGTAYLDDGSASAIFARGYYGRSAITAWKLVDGKLQMQWAFDIPSDHPYAAQGNHQLSINDVDGDGYDEIIYGSLAVDHDGQAMYATGLGHGDAMHVSDWNGDGRLEVYGVHEETEAEYGMELHDAETGEILWGYFTGKDTGRGVAADIDPNHEGAEMWSNAMDGTYDCSGNLLYAKHPSVNFSIYWDGDLQMELFDYEDGNLLTPQVQKWDPDTLASDVLLEAAGATLNNGTKGNAGLVADICGDWREEFIVRDATDPAKIRVYSTNLATDYVFPCLLTDRTYREGVAWQNSGYNQPANLPYLLTAELSR